MVLLVIASQVAYTYFATVSIDQYLAHSFIVILIYIRYIDMVNKELDLEKRTKHNPSNRDEIMVQMRELRMRTFERLTNETASPEVVTILSIIFSAAGCVLYLYLHSVYPITTTFLLLFTLGRFNCRDERKIVFDDINRNCYFWHFFGNLLCVSSYAHFDLSKRFILYWIQCNSFQKPQTIRS